MKRRNSEIKRLNDLYVNSIPVHNTLSKCLKYLCQTEPYRMLCDWSFEMNGDPLDDEGSTAAPDITDVRSSSLNKFNVKYSFTSNIYL